MTRARAVRYLLGERRDMPHAIDGLTVSAAEGRLQWLDAFDRLVLDVRAGRVREFRVEGLQPVEVSVID